jgi:hypothetical protein
MALTLMSQTIESPAEPVEPKKASGKVSKAQKRAQQAEFNRQLWQQACVQAEMCRNTADRKAIVKDHKRPTISSNLAILSPSAPSSSHHRSSSPAKVPRPKPQTLSQMA